MTDTITLPRSEANALYELLLSGEFYSDYDESMEMVGKLRAALAQQAEQALPEYFAQYEYAPDFSVVVSIYRRQKDDVPTLIHTETLPKQIGDGEQVAQQAGWQPIETAPKDGTEVLLGEPDGSITVAYWNERKEEFTTDGGYSALWATHWMPLPAAPKGGAA